MNNRNKKKLGKSLDIRLSLSAVIHRLFSIGTSKLFGIILAIYCIIVHLPCKMQVCHDG